MCMLAKIQAAKQWCTCNLARLSRLRDRHNLKTLHCTTVFQGATHTHYSYCRLIMRLWSKFSQEKNSSFDPYGFCNNNNYHLQVNLYHTIIAS